MGRQGPYHQVAIAGRPPYHHAWLQQGACLTRWSKPGQIAGDQASGWPALVYSDGESPPQEVLRLGHCLARPSLACRHLGLAASCRRFSLNQGTYTPASGPSPVPGQLGMRSSADR